LDASTRFYLLWRYTYRSAELDAGEAIVFANGTHVELDGQHGLSAGGRRLVEKKKNKYALRDYAARGDDENLGLPHDSGETAPLIDVLHRVLWLMENRPRDIGKFLIEAGPNRDQMRLVVQALTGPALKGGELSDVSPTGELGVLAKLASNWRAVIDDAVTSAREREDRRTGQRDIAVGQKLDGLLLHENFIMSLIPLHLGMRQSRSASTMSYARVTSAIRETGMLPILPMPHPPPAVNPAAGSAAPITTASCARACCKRETRPRERSVPGSKAISSVGLVPMARSIGESSSRSYSVRHHFVVSSGRLAL
jgi:hypothetical protein